MSTLKALLIVLTLLLAISVPAAAINSAGIQTRVARSSSDPARGAYINIGNGNLILERTDITLQNPGIVLGVTRYFNSLDWDVARNAAYVNKDAAVPDRVWYTKSCVGNAQKYRRCVNRNKWNITSIRRGSV